MPRLRVLARRAADAPGGDDPLRLGLLRLLPDAIDGVRIVGVDVPGFGIPTHAEAKDIPAGAMLNYAREEAEAGKVPAPERIIADRPTGAPLGEVFPADPMIIDRLLAPMGLAAGPVVPCREWRELHAALDCGAVAAIHPFYTAAAREFEAAGRPVIGPAPVDRDGTDAWLCAIADIFNVPAAKRDGVRDAMAGAIAGGLAAAPIKGRTTLSGYKGSALLVARLLIESGADVPYVGAACPKTRWSAPDLEWLEAKGVRVKFRASLEDDLMAMEALKPDLAIGTTPVVQKAKQLGLPALHFTNLISARPMMARPRPARGRRWSTRPSPGGAAWTECAISSRASARATPPASGSAIRRCGPGSAPSGSKRWSARRATRSRRK